MSSALTTNEHWTGEDWAEALGEPTGNHDTRNAKPGDAFLAEIGGARIEPPRREDIAEVTDFYATKASYSQDPRHHTADPNAALELYVICRLVDGRWAALWAYHDHTGWGCEDAVEWRIGESREQVIRSGMDQEGRRRLGLVSS